jgi:His/Glu/Gln/Arg/opine family amino acid ABC transporter permease subunit
MTEQAAPPAPAHTGPAPGPPDTRGPTSTLPASILVLGGVALGLLFLGTVAIQVSYALGKGPFTQTCVDQDLQPGTAGADGVCHIVQALLSDAETVVLAGSIVVGLAAVALGLGVYRRMDTRRKREHAITGAVLGIQAVVLAAVVLWFRSGTPGRFVKHFLNFARLEGYLGSFVTGAKNTLILAFSGEIGGIILGLIAAILVLSPRAAVRAPARTYINFFRGTPLIWQLAAGSALFLSGFDLHMSPFTVAILIFAVNTGAYAAEVFRAGIQSIERGQMEAARSLGMSYVQSMRYAILPQAIRRVIPPLMNEFVILIKDTSLIIVLGLLASQYELFTTAREGFSDTFNATFFVAAAIGYLAVTLPMIYAVNRVERRLRSGLVGITG